MTGRIVRIGAAVTPCLIVGALLFTASYANAAPRGSKAWCEQMLDKPRNAWSINDNIAWGDHCQAQQKAWERAVLRQNTMPNINGSHEEELNNPALKALFKDGLLGPNTKPANLLPPNIPPPPGAQ